MTNDLKHEIIQGEDVPEWSDTHFYIQAKSIQETCGSNQTKIMK